MIQMINKIKKHLESITKLKILLIGDTIIDVYTFVNPKGRAIKDPILSVGFKTEEKYAGGILAIANHLSTYVDKIKMVTLVGDKNDEIDFLMNSVGKNVDVALFTKPDSMTTIKKRYVDFYKNNKLFKVEYLDDFPISDDLSCQISSYLAEEIPKYDLVIVGDFGHGFIDKRIRKVLEEKAKFLVINVQSNSSNMGYNYVNHYKRADFLSLDDQEARLPLMMRFEDVEEVAKEFEKRFGFSRFMITLGKKGSLYYNNGQFFRHHALANSIKDTVGAGDALFSITSLFIYSKIDDDVIPFIANCAGAIKTQYSGNKESVTKDRLLDFLDKSSGSDIQQQTKQHIRQ